MGTWPPTTMAWTVLLRQEFLDGVPTARGRTDLMLADSVVILAFVARGCHPVDPENGHSHKRTLLPTMGRRQRYCSRGVVGGRKLPVTGLGASTGRGVPLLLFVEKV